MTDPVSSTLQQRTLSILFTLFALAGVFLQNNWTVVDAFHYLMSNKDHLSLAEPTFSRSVPYSHPALPVPDQTTVVLSFRTTSWHPSCSYWVLSCWRLSENWLDLLTFSRPVLPRCYFERNRSSKIIPLLELRSSVSCLGYSPRLQI